MPETDREAVLRVLRAQEAAIARGDAAGAIAAMAEDIVAYDLPPPLESRGPAARNIAGLEKWFATWEDGVTVDLVDPQVLIGGDLAVVFGLSRMRGHKKGEGRMDSWSRRTVALRRQNDAWTIVHDHGSFPMLMDGSGKAAIDLHPDGS